MSSKKSQYQTKKVAFQGKEMTLYSLDGVTWSTRPDELELIIQRHSTEQAAFTSDLKGEEREKVEKVKPKAKKFHRVHNDDELDEIIEEDTIEDLDEDIPLDDIDEDDQGDYDADGIPPSKTKLAAGKSGRPQSPSVASAGKVHTKKSSASGKGGAKVPAVKSKSSASSAKKKDAKPTKVNKPSKAKVTKPSSKGKKPASKKK